MKKTALYGFTLLEMLLVLALMATLMLAVTQLMSQTATVWNDSDRDIRALENDKIALNFIRRMLDRAKPVSWQPQQQQFNAVANGFINNNTTVETQNVPKRTFIGEADKFYFAAPLPAVAEQMGMYLFSIRVGDNEYGKNSALLLDYWLLDNESMEKTLQNPKNTEVLMTDVSSISLSYFGDNDYSDGPDQPDWHGEWQALRDPPLALRMDIKRSAYDEDDSDSLLRRDWQGLTFGILQRSLF